MTSLNRPLVRQWINMLRSGEYTQGRHRLRSKRQTNDEFCCLGVLCDIAPTVEWQPAPKGVDAYNATVGVHKSAISLPKPVLWLAGLTEKQESELIELNDDGKGFEEIAQYLERLLEDSHADRTS